MIPFMVDDVRYDFDESRLPLFEALAIKKHTGLNVSQFLGGLLSGEAAALAGLVFLAKKRAGEPVKWEDLHDLDIMALIESINTLAVETVELPDDAPSEDAA